MTPAAVAFVRPWAAAGTRDVPRDHDAIVEVAARMLMPSLIFGTVFVQQPAGTALYIVGQAMLWVSLLAAAELVVVLLGEGRLLLVLAGSLIAFRLARGLLGESLAMTTGYEASNGLIYAFAGAAVMAKRGEMLHRQIITFLAVSVPVMLAQLLGRPAWIQALRRDIHGREYEGSMMVRTLFESSIDASYNSLQARPAGLLHAALFLSIVLLFAMAIHFAQSRGRRLSRGDVALIAVVVLAMAKIVMLTFLLFSVVYFVVGPHEARVRFGKRLLLVTAALGVYYLLFPGVFSYNLSPTRAFMNFSVRLADLRASMMGVESFTFSMERIGGERVTLYKAGEQSGYGSMGRSLLILAPVFAVAMLSFVRRVRQLGQTRPEFVEIGRNGVIIFLLAPLVTPFFGNPFYSFAMGAVLVPWFVSPAGTPGHASTVQSHDRARRPPIQSESHILGPAL